MRASPLAAHVPPAPEPNGSRPMLPPVESPDWLTLQQASCELGASVSTIRRMVRDGRLLNRMVPHRGGFAYLVFIPQSRHGALRQQEPKRRKLWLIKSAREQPARPFAPAAAEAQPPVADPGAEATIANLERQVDQLSHALSRALKMKQRALPAGIGDPGVNDGNPYARYRWLRRRRWWPF
jgi:hypothetical protein